jgi:hypothetical protein
LFGEEAGDADVELVGLTEAGTGFGVSSGWDGGGTALTFLCTGSSFGGVTLAGAGSSTAFSGCTGSGILTLGLATLTFLVAGSSVGASTL